MKIVGLIVSVSALCLLDLIVAEAEVACTDAALVNDVLADEKKECLALSGECVKPCIIPCQSEVQEKVCVPECVPECPPLCPPLCAPGCEPACAPGCGSFNDLYDSLYPYALEDSEVLAFCPPMCPPLCPPIRPPVCPPLCPPLCPPACPPQCPPVCPPICIPDRCPRPCPDPCSRPCPRPCPNPCDDDRISFFLGSLWWAIRRADTPAQRAVLRRRLLFLIERATQLLRCQDPCSSYDFCSFEFIGERPSLRKLFRILKSILCKLTPANRECLLGSYM
ncbi:hypothetical protein NEFER03_0991 [Nematocida sp. LUAm3]|nr:hypothetical protein NEFER03_0991 [Nematocida sp. LUAm3]KAI5175405.1 hypothetical protein NEFER02_1334 [Nematocida sp. LUAm2]KAI5177638.1 hypothetical protein NEFER01_0862 [Nematocida sp. LUAm1]